MNNFAPNKDDYDLAQNSIQAITLERGWLVAVVLIVVVIEVASYLETTHLMTNVSNIMSSLEENRAEDLRRMNETIRVTTGSLATLLSEEGNLTDKEYKDLINRLEKFKDEATTP